MLRRKKVRPEKGGYTLYTLIYIKFKLIHHDRKHVTCLEKRWKEG